MAATLIMLTGMPGAGKTTLARKMEAERDAIRLSPDEWIEALMTDKSDIPERDRLRDPVENLQWDLAQGYLRRGKIVILENGFWTSEERYQYAMEALEIGVVIELHYLEATPDELWRRIQVRNTQLAQPTFVMTQDDVESAVRAFEAPTAEELEFYDDWSITR